MVGLVMPALIYHFELNSRSVGIFLVAVRSRVGRGRNSGESRYGSSQTLPYWGTLQGRPVAFSLNPLLLKLALRQKWSEIRTISRQRLGSGDSEYSHFSFHTWPIPSSSG